MDTKKEFQNIYSFLINEIEFSYNSTNPQTRIKES